MGWDCSRNRLGKAFDLCPDYFQVCQNLNDTNNPGFSERDDVACAASPFQSNLSSWQKNRCTQSHRMARAWFQLKFKPDTFFITSLIPRPTCVIPLVLTSAGWLSICRSSCCSSGVASDKESQEIGTLITWAYRCNAEPSLVVRRRPIVARRSAPLLLPVPLSGHGKLVLYSVLDKSRGGFHYTCGSCTLH